MLKFEQTTDLSNDANASLYTGLNNPTSIRRKLKLDNTYHIHPRDRYFTLLLRMSRVGNRSECQIVVNSVPLFVLDLSFTTF